MHIPSRILQISDSVEYFLGDALGSVRQVVNSQGFVRTGSYTPYGERLGNNVLIADTRFGFTGEMSDAGLLCLRARHYDPEMGRFTTRDTWGGTIFDPLSLNRWNYVDANPTNRKDPSGLCWYYHPMFGGITYDRTRKPINGPCEWWRNELKTWGISVPLYESPQLFMKYKPSWLDFISYCRSYPPALLPNDLNQPISLGEGIIWQVIKYLISKQWIPYEDILTDISVESPYPIILPGGPLSPGGSYSCGTAGKCDLSAHLAYGIKWLDIGLGSQTNTQDLSTRVGLYGAFGELDAFVSPSKLSWSSPADTSYTMQTILPVQVGLRVEKGTEQMGEYAQYWVLTQTSTVAEAGGYYGFAYRYLQYISTFSKVTYQILAQGTDVEFLRYAFATYHLLEFP